MTGRRTKLTAERVEVLCNKLRQGMTIKIACMAAGICEATYYRWHTEAEGKRPPKMLLEFREATTRAIVEGEQALAATVRKAAITDWKAAAWFLERRFSADWSNKQRVTGSLEISAGPDADDEADAAAVLIARLRDGR